MTFRQQQFVQEYLIDSNAQEAAKRAGYSPRTAKSGARRLLKNLEVAEAIKQGRLAQNGSCRVDRDYVITHLCEIVERCMAKSPVCDVSGRQLVDDKSRSVWAFNAEAAIRALELLGRHLGMFGAGDMD